MTACHSCQFCHKVNIRGTCNFISLKSWLLRQPGIEPGSTAWKATMLTVTPLTLLEICLFSIHTANICFFYHIPQVSNIILPCPQGWQLISTRNFLLKHQWFSGKMLAYHPGGQGSIPGRCKGPVLCAIVQGWQIGIRQDVSKTCPKCTTIHALMTATAIFNQGPKKLHIGNRLKGC